MNFHVEITKTAEMVVQANSIEEVRQAVAGMTSMDIDDWAGEWEHFISNSNAEADSGVLHGEIVSIEDMPTEEELLENETEDERYYREYAIGDHRQLSMQVAI